MRTYDFAGSLEKCGALWKAPPVSKFNPRKPHAELTSGRHSDGFVNLSMMLSDPAELHRACGYLTRKAIAEWGATFANPLNADWVIGSAIGGITICHEVATWLDARCAFTEKSGDLMEMLRFVIPEDATCLVVEDVMTTGGTCIKTVQELRRLGRRVMPLFLTTTNRRKLQSLEVEGQTFSISSLDMNVDFKDWDEKACPYCELGSEPLRPKEGKNWAKFIS